MFLLEGACRKGGENQYTHKVLGGDTITIVCQTAPNINNYPHIGTFLKNVAA